MIVIIIDGYHNSGRDCRKISGADGANRTN